MHAWRLLYPFTVSVTRGLETRPACEDVSGVYRNHIAGHRTTGYVDALLKCNPCYDVRSSRKLPRPPEEFLAYIAVDLSPIIRRDDSDANIRIANLSLPPLRH